MTLQTHRKETNCSPEETAETAEKRNIMQELSEFSKGSLQTQTSPPCCDTQKQMPADRSLDGGGGRLSYYALFSHRKQKLNPEVHSFMS